MEILWVIEGDDKKSRADRQAQCVALLAPGATHSTIGVWRLSLTTEFAIDLAHELTFELTSEFTSNGKKQGACAPDAQHFERAIDIIGSLSQRGLKLAFIENVINNCIPTKSLSSRLSTTLDDFATRSSNGGAPPPPPPPARCGCIATGAL